jgi:HK97 family phage major capsid protein
MNVKVVGDMTTSGSLTGDPVRTYNSRQGLVPFQKVNMRDLIPTVQSATGTFVTYRETGSEGSISTQTEGSGKSQIDYDLTEIVTVNNYIAGFARFSKQLMKNLPFLEGTLSRMLLRDFYKAENSAFFTTVSGAATGSGTVAATTSDIEAIIELVANQLAANFNPSYALVNPKQMARLQKETFTNGYYAGAGAVSLTPNGINIAGMPVLPASWVTDNYILIIDQDYLERVEVESMNVVFSYEDGTNFTTNKVTARIECQEAVNTLRVDSLIYKDLTSIS